MDQVWNCQKNVVPCGQPILRKGFTLNCCVIFESIININELDGFEKFKTSGDVDIFSDQINGTFGLFMNFIFFFISVWWGGRQGGFDGSWRHCKKRYPFYTLNHFWLWTQNY